MKLNLKRNNKGVALISVIIAVAFISIIASSLLYISFSNYSIKVANNESKKNFYEVEGDLTKITTALRANLASNSSEPITVLKDYCQTTAPDALPSKYDVIKLARLVYPYDSSDLTLKNNIVVGNSDTVGFNYPGNGDYVNISSSDGNNTVVLQKWNATSGSWEAFTGTKMDNGLYKIVFKNVLIKHVSNNTNAVLDDYENTVKTDIVVQVSKTPGSKSAIGGIGEFSILMDEQLLINGADFSTMNIYGNSMTANYVYSSTLSATIPRVSGGTNADAGLSLTGDNRVNVMGSYFVVFGDLIISDHSSLYLNGCNMMVYGDIYLKDNGCLICSADSSICMVGIKGKNAVGSYTSAEVTASLLPGRSEVTNILDDSGSVMGEAGLKQHVYPSTMVITRLNKADSYDKYASLMHFDDTDANNDGVLNNILNTTNSVADHKLNVKDINDKKDISGTDYYGEEVGVLIDKASTQNGGQKNRLIFYNYDYASEKAKYDLHPDWYGYQEPKNYVLMQESNINSTVISSAALNVDQKHTITLSKLGSDKFDYLTIKYGDSDYRKTDKFHDVELIAKPNGTEYKTQTSIGNFFTNTTINSTEYTPNSLVEALLGCSSDSDTTASPITQSVLYMENWEKDFQKN